MFLSKLNYSDAVKSETSEWIIMFTVYTVTEFLSKKSISVTIFDDESFELILLLNKKAENKKNFEIITEADIKNWINNVKDLTEVNLKMNQLSEDEQIETA